MTPDAGRKGRRRLLVVEDETLIGMLLEDMLSDLGYEVVGTAPTVRQAMDVLHGSELDAAILDVNVNGEAINPVAAILRDRGVPFMFASGYGERGVPAEFRGCPVLQKPFQQEELENALASLFAEEQGAGAAKPGVVER
ncbi:MAG: response regulator [Variibacter sp.]